MVSMPRILLKSLTTGIDPRLRARGRFLDAQLRNTRLDRFGHAAKIFHLFDMLPCPLCQFVSKAFDVIAASPGIDRLAGVGLPLQEELRVAGDAGTEIRRQRERFIQRVGVQRLGMALRRRHRLDTGSDDVVEYVLRRQAPSRCLAMGTQ